jgi:superfamily II DNA or RNA helicase
MDYVPVFLAHGWYKNRTEFCYEHVVYNRHVKYPKVDRYLNIGKLIRLRDAVIVKMHYQRRTIAHDKNIMVPFDRELLNSILIKRWDIYDHCPIQNIARVCYLMRKVVNSDPRRADTVKELMKKHPRAIIFYNFDYERDLLLAIGADLNIPTAEWSGHKHEQIPETEEWLYIVQYTAGAEGWNCIETNVIIFYSQNYSYKATVQAAGRIDRLNTPYTDLYYYYLRSTSVIDLAIQKAYNNKKDFNEHRFMAA